MDRIIRVFSGGEVLESSDGSVELKGCAFQTLVFERPPSFTELKAKLLESFQSLSTYSLLGLYDVSAAQWGRCRLYLELSCESTWALHKEVVKTCSSYSSQDLLLKDISASRGQREGIVTAGRFMPGSPAIPCNNQYQSPPQSQSPYRVSLNEGEHGIRTPLWQTLNTVELTPPSSSGSTGQMITTAVPGISSARVVEPIAGVSLDDLAIGSNELDRHAYADPDTEDEDWYVSDDDSEGSDDDDDDDDDDGGNNENEETIVRTEGEMTASSLPWRPLFGGIQSSAA